MKKCRRCGRCCLLIDGKGNTFPCQFLKFNNKLKYYFCLVYRTRLGRVIAVINDQKIRCVERSKTPYDYVGCPYNDGKAIKFL